MAPKVSAAIAGIAFEVLRRASEDDGEDEPDSSQMEIFSSWALFIMIMLLITALFTSYMLQQKKVEAVHETVISIFAVGLILRVSAGTSIQNLVTFDYQIFFNLLLPPIILGSGYELHQANFFRNIGTILTFAFAGTFISAIVLGLILWLYTRIPLDGFELTLVDAISVGATLSATDPVTILAIFNTYKVDPKLYTIIFGESILNDAVAIVLFETAQRYKEGGAAGTLGFISLIEGVGIFLAVFFGSLIIGVIVGVGTALGLKYTYVRRFPKIESCLIILIAYASYFLSNGLHMSGRIVTLLFCGISLKHYAYYNMSRRTQLTTKYLFQVLAQLSENFIFIYLGLSLFTESKMEFKPLFIIVTIIGICVARWVAVFPLSRTINWVIRYKAKRKGRDVADELPYNYQAMLFWAGLRGAVGVALAAGMTGTNAWALKATVLVVVVLTVIIFGGTTARMLEILGIKTGVVEEIDSDDEFDIEAVSGGSYYKHAGSAIGHDPRRGRGNGSVALDALRSNGNGRGPERGSYVSGNNSPQNRPLGAGRKGSANGRARTDSEQELLTIPNNLSDDEVDVDSDSSDLPPAAKRPPNRNPPGPQAGDGSLDTPYPTSGSTTNADTPHMTASGAISQLFHGTVEDHAAWFKQLDEGFIKPKLLLDGGKGGRHGGPSGS
ncbi:Endosomal prevacuolar sodium hydrogen exchanger [Hyphodiscus hymeniophilus]|uniref:Sodium/hydrogen exchanger n=1 Tax=Hyphodiscus hymeniophilus TaxID=353542 RepID=A0A9P6VRD8_9HELO|nr:Endosomal prevacuolar sodium hydrogen exchanger [Hyphodiscus hymeniophilus]